MGKAMKLLLVLPALVVLAFVGLVVWGQLQPACKGPPKGCADDYAPGDLMNGAGGWLGRAGPQASLPKPRYELASMGSMQVVIGPSNDNEDLRTLKLLLRQGAAQLRFQNTIDHPGMPLQEQAEPTTLPREALRPEDSRRLSFAVTKGGGTLFIACSAGPCIVEPDAGR